MCNYTGQLLFCNNVTIKCLELENVAIWMLGEMLQSYPTVFVVFEIVPVVVAVKDELVHLVALDHIASGLRVLFYVD